MKKKSDNAQGSTNTREQPARRATARVLPGAPGSATGCFCRHSRSGYRSWDVLRGWRSSEAPRRKQRRGYSDRTSERSRDLVGASVVCEANVNEKRGLRRPCNLFRPHGWSSLCWGQSGLALRLLRWPCLSRMGDPTCEAVDNTAQICVACFSFRNTPRRVGKTPQTV